ncbi:MAG: hypothetical protein Q9165_007480 [Trypethelium subeluteriae]
MEVEQPQPIKSTVDSRQHQFPLQKLNTLDDENEDFQSRLARIAAATGLPHSVLETDSPDSAALVPHQRHHARLEWVLRWLLDKLQSQEVVGSEARASPQAWRCLRTLCQCLPRSRIVHQLTSHEILSALETSLSQTYSMFEQVQKDQVHGDSEDRPQLGKRKRTESVDGDTRSGLRSAVQKPVELFLATVGFLESFNVLFQDETVNGAPPVHEQIKSVARGIDFQAPDLLGNWLLCVKATVRNAAISVPIWREGTQWHWIRPILPIWESQKLDASTALFSKTCLVPASMLLVTLERELENRVSFHLTSAGATPKYATKTDVDALKATLSILEQLLAKHVFRPMQAQIATPVSKPSLAKGLPMSIADSESDESRLKRSVERLDLMLAPLLEASGQVSPNALISGFVRQAVPRLLDIAIRSSSPSRSSKPNTLWLEAVFAVLGHCIGVLASDGTSSVLQSDSVSIMTLMLETLSNRGMALTIYTLAKIAGRYSGLLESKSDADGVQTLVHWDLLAVILQQDADVFLPVESVQRKLSATEREIPEALLKTLSKLGGRVEKVGSMDASVDGFIRRRSEIVDNIVSPLIRAYAQRRMLDKFFQALPRLVQDSYSSLGLAYLIEGEHENSEDSLLWEDSRVTVALRPLVENHLSPNQVSRLVDTFLPLILVVNNDGKHKASGTVIELETTSSVSTGLLLIKLLIEALESDDYQDQLQSQIALIRSNLLKLLQIQNIKKLKARWLIWRILSLTSPNSSLTRNPSGQEQFGNDATEASSVELAIDECYVNGTMKHNYTVVYEALSFLACSLQQEATGQRHIQEIERCLSLASDFAANTFSSMDDNANAPQIKWNGQPQSIQNPQQLALAFSCVLVKYPAAFQLIRPSSRQALLQQLYKATSVSERDRSEDGKTGVSLGMIWGSLENYAIHSGPHTIREEFLDVLSSRLRSIPSQESDHPVDAHKILEATIDHQRIPLLVLKRSRREQLLNFVSERLSQKPRDDSADAIIHGYLTFMLRLMQIPNAAADLSTDYMTLWRIADVIDRYQGGTESAYNNILDELEELGRLVFSYHLSTIEQNRSRQYLTDSHGHAVELLKSRLSYPPKFGTLRLLTVSFALWDDSKWAKELAPSLEESRSISRAYVRELLAVFETAIFMTSIYTRRMMLRAVFSGALKLSQAMVDSYNVGVDPDGARCLPPLDRAISGWLAESVEKGYCSGTEPALAFQFVTKHNYSQLRDIAAEGDVDIGNVKNALALLRNNSGVRDRLRIVDAFKVGLERLDTQQKYKVLQQLHMPREELSSNQSSLLRVIIKSLQLDKESDSPLVIEFQALLPLSCASLMKVKDVQTFSELSDCILMMLREKRWLVFQYGLDTLILTLIAFVAPAGPSLPAESGRLVYRRLCEMVEAAINRHRAKFGGRFHLLSPLLSNLLDALFVPDNRSYSSYVRKPPWLTHGTAAFGGEEGAAFASVLTSLCDPTVSSVTTRKSQREHKGLVDETRKARAYAGQYMQDVLMEFCRAQLRGRLQPRVRRRLMPGLYATIAVMSEDGLRAMNASMDPSARALWKSLYDEWRRFGVSKEQ